METDNEYNTFNNMTLLGSVFYFLSTKFHLILKTTLEGRY